MTKEGILAVLKLLNAQCSHRVPDIAKALDQWWPDVEPKLEAASTSTETARVRDQEDLLEEILTIVRGLQAPQPVRRRFAPGRTNRTFEDALRSDGSRSCCRTLPKFILPRFHIT
jgi:hypothetical protein